jgi:Protein of unknown function (DUF1592)/Protein of unknown function (DUF1588)/Protein of unknown function (DUF1587)/Protein of unknown function (DUF1585)/Protein of unknown function (DUF1595)/Planctomycete cytochrome C
MRPLNPSPPWRRLFALTSGLLLSVSLLQADDYADKVLPILKDSCLNCHSTKKQKGDVDLERFATVADIRQSPKVWESVLEQVASGEMPPKKEKPLSAAAKKVLLDWTHKTLDEIAIANAGDPGPVVLRRLSNAEYTYAVQDLTRVPSLDPAREFPVDGSAGEGFTNVGAALVMSPGLLSKYLDAGKDVAQHAVLLSDGLAFSEKTTKRDWTNEKIAAIKAFYARYSVSGKAESVLVQGNKVDLVGGDGRLPLGLYLAATLTHRDALRNGTTTIAQVAQLLGLNAKYLGTIWSSLNEVTPSTFLDPVRADWRKATPADVPALVASIKAWQNSLWRFGAIGHIGKQNGPKGWQLPVDPVVTMEDFRVAIPAGDTPKVYLSSANLRSGRASLVWSKPRVVVKGKPDIAVALPAGKPSGPNQVIEVNLPAGLPKGAEFLIEGHLPKEASAEACVQAWVTTTPPVVSGRIVPTGAPTNKKKGGMWSDGEGAMGFTAPLLVTEGGVARQELLRSAQAFRDLFPSALCYASVVPVDEVVTLTLFYREDEALRRLMLDDKAAAEIDRLWSDLRFISQDALLQVESFESLYQFATQDANPKAFEPLREPIKRRAAEFQQELLAAEPKHVDAVVRLAADAWRRPLKDGEADQLRALYQELRKQELPHDLAVRRLIARVLVSSAFLYRGEKAAAGEKAAPVNDWELATRLSFFLWSSAPDAELRALAASGKLHEPAVLAAQMRRMVKDAKSERLAREFGCQWLHVRDVATLDEKSERHFPTFVSLRGAMQEEAERFFADLFQQDRPVLSLIDADHVFVNGPLALHYGLKVTGEGWQRVDAVRAQGRGGVLAFASTLARQSGASRTSPILRGNWLTEVLLGEKLPRPPKGVPILPETAPQGLTERQLIEKHSSDPACARCHQRVDPFGFALEGFDAIGRARSKDAAGLDIDTRTVLPGGVSVDGLNGLRDYLLTRRQDDFLRQFSRKLLGYSLGRAVQLSDKPLLDAMVARLKTGEGRVSGALELIVLSSQFREVRGRDFKTNH